MRVTLASLLALVTVQAAASVVPVPHADGVWVQLANETEPRLVQALGEITPPSRRALLAARDPPALPDPQPHCNNYGMSRADFNSAKDAFDSYLDQGIYFGAVYTVYLTRGTAVAYMCVYGGTQRGWRQEYDQAMSLVDVTCTNTGAGWVYISAYSKSYGRANSGVPIC